MEKALYTKWSWSLSYMVQLKISGIPSLVIMESSLRIAGHIIDHADLHIPRTPPVNTVSFTDEIDLADLHFRPPELGRTI